MDINKTTYTTCRVCYGRPRCPTLSAISSRIACGTPRSTTLCRLCSSWFDDLEAPRSSYNFGSKKSKVKVTWIENGRA